MHLFNNQLLTEFTALITTPTRPKLICCLRAVDKRYRFLYRFFMKTTLNLSDDLVAQAKALAAKERITLTRMIEEGLVLRLRRQKNRSARKFKELPVSQRCGGLCPGVDGTSNRSLFDAANA